MQSKSSNTQVKKVRGYIKPLNSFYTLDEWEHFVVQMLRLQELGYDSRGGVISCKHASPCESQKIHEIKVLIEKFFAFQLGVEVDRYDLLTEKKCI